MVMGSDRVTLGQLEDQSFTGIWRGHAYESFTSKPLGQRLRSCGMTSWARCGLAAHGGRTRVGAEPGPAHALSW
jgi:hypothetical protein